MSTVFVQVEGSSTPVPLAELAWEHVAPCGCTCGVMVAETADHDAAHREFTPNSELRRRDTADGFVFRLALRELVLDRLGQKCAHDPRYGRAEVRVPDGYQWAEATGQRRLHLVAVDPDATKPFPVRAKHVHAGPRGSSEWWRQGWPDTPTCRTCERWATRQTAVTA